MILTELFLERNELLENITFGSNTNTILCLQRWNTLCC